MSKSAKQLTNGFKDMVDEEFNEALTMEKGYENLQKKIEWLESENKSLLKSDINENNVPEKIEETTNQILKLKDNFQKNIWLIGQRLNYILDKQLYKDLKDEHGEPLYSSFAKYVNSELDFQERTAFNFINVFKNYELQTVAVVDYSKLLVITKISDENVRKNLLEKVKNEKLSKRDVDKEVKQLIQIESDEKKSSSNDDGTKQEISEDEKQPVKASIEYSEDEDYKIIHIRIPHEKETIYKEIKDFLENTLVERTK